MDTHLRWPVEYGLHLRVLAAAGLLWVLACLHRRNRSFRARGCLSLPPGPKPLPVVGNALDIPLKSEWETLSKWAEEYGDIVHVEVFGRHIVYLNTYKAAADLFEKRGTIYSDKPRLVLLNEMLDFDWNFGLMHYGDTWKRYRRAFVSQFGGAVVHRFNPIQEKCAALLLERLLQSPDSFLDHIRLHAGQLIMMTVYNMFIDSRDHPYVETAELVMSHVSEAARPGAQLLDFIPLLKKMPSWFPGTHYKRVVPKWAADVRRLRKAPFEACKAQLAHRRGPSLPCFVADMLENHDSDDKDMEVMIQDCAALAYGAGGDTSVAALTSFVLAMVLFPEVQKKAQEEIRMVVGTSRLATFEDRERLPYITAMVKETLRWHSVGPQAMPHRLTEEDVYNGYLLPKDSIVVGNVWRMAHDPSVYPDPFDFKPERFFDSHGTLDYAAIDPAKFSFGFGRRLCAGHHFAEATMFIVISNVLQCFNIEHAKDEAGKNIPVGLNPTSGMISAPEPFLCSITPRSDEAKELIRHVAAEALSIMKR